MKTYILSTIFIAILMFGCAGSQLKTNANDMNTSKAEDVETLAKLMTGREMMEKAFKQLLNQLTQYILQKNPNVDEEMVSIITKEFEDVMQENMDYFITMNAKIYDKYFTHSEIRDLIAFYQSDTGKKFTENVPAIMAESMEYGMKLQEYIVPIVVERIKNMFEKRGYDLQL